MNESLVEVRRGMEGAERCSAVLANGLRLRLDGQQRESLVGPSAIGEIALS